MIAAAIRRRPALAAAIAVFAVGALALALTRHQAPLPLPRAQAVAAAFKSPRVHQALRRTDWQRRQGRIGVEGVDQRLERITFYEGGQAAVEVALRRDRTVLQVLVLKNFRVPYGDWIAYQPAVLIVLAALFLLATAVAPWRRLRNLDVLMALTLLAPVIILQHHYVGASVLSALPGLLYLMARCAAVGLAGARPVAPSTSLLDRLTAGWEIQRRVRLLRLLVMALGLAFLLVTVSTFDAVDVLYAVMEGATKLLGGLLPYGHMPGDVIHGDTYPLLSYALYVPVAWLSPVRSIWDSVDVALGLTVAAVLGTAWAVFRVAASGDRKRTSRRSPESELAGLRSALTWLAFPPVLVIASSGTSDVVLAAMLAGAVLLWRRPGICTGLLTAAAWFKLAPAALIPLRLASLRGRALAGPLAAIALVSLPLIALLMALGGSAGPMAMLHAISFQFSRGSPQSVWAALGISGLQPVAEGALLALIAAAMVRLRAEPELANDRARMAALAAAVLVGLQLVANYWAFLYLVWAWPLLAMSVLGEPRGVAVPSTDALTLRPADAQTVGVLA